MGFGGQFNPDFSPGSYIFNQMKSNKEESQQLQSQQHQRNLERANRLMSQKPRLTQPAIPIPNQQISQPIQPQQQPQGSDWLQQWVQNLQNSAQSQSLPVKQPAAQSIEPAISPVKPTPMENVPVPNMTTQEQPKMDSGSDLDNRLNSNDPGVFSNAMEELGTLDEGKLSPDSPAFNMIQKADSQYGLGVTEQGERMYQCPLTKTPCGKKTFWTRLKEFFQTILGLKSRDEAVKSVSKLDSKDPITKQYSQPQVKAQKPAVSSVWQNRGIM